ncbi:hypothetical protein Tco_0871596, partial [Tanacetum coccineum]
MGNTYGVFAGKTPPKTFPAAASTEAAGGRVVSRDIWEEEG